MLIWGKISKKEGITYGKTAIMEEDKFGIGSDTYGRTDSGSGYF